MSRTYRLRHKVPKGYNVVNRDGTSVTIDKDGDVVWISNYSGLEITYRPYWRQGVWAYGYGLQTTMVETWKQIWFDKIKVPHTHKVVKFFCPLGRYSYCDWNKKKSVRRRTHLRIHDEDFDILVKHEGKKSIPARALRRAQCRYRAVEEETD